MAADSQGVADLSTPGRQHWTVAYAFAPDGRSARLVAASANDYSYSPRFRIEIAGAVLLFTGLLLAFATRVLLHWQKRSEEHTSELQSLMRISYAVFCLKKKKENHT